MIRPQFGSLNHRDSPKRKTPETGQRQGRSGHVFALHVPRLPALISRPFGESPDALCAEVVDPS
jgi:hypothetical protein